MTAEQPTAEELRQAAVYAQAFADLVRSVETKYAFKQLAVRWDREAEEIEAAARLRSLKDER